MKLNDAIFGLLLLALGATVLIMVQSFPKIPGQQVGPALFPGLIAIGICIGGLILLVRGVRGARQRLREGKAAAWFSADDWVRSPRHLLAFAVLIASVIFYMLASQTLGFLVCSVLVLTALFCCLQVPVGRAVSIAIIVSLLIHFAFYKLLRVPLPWGILQNYTW